MNLFQFTSSIIDSLAWPALIGFILVRHEGVVGELIKRLQRLSVFGNEAEFESEAKEVAEKASSINDDEQQTNTAEGAVFKAEQIANAWFSKIIPQSLDFNRLREISVDDPNLALAGVRIGIETTFNNIIRELKIDVGNKRKTIGLLMNVLRQHQIIDYDTQSIINDVLALANKGVHGEKVDTRSANWVINAAEDITGRLAAVSFIYAENNKIRLNDGP